MSKLKEMKGTPVQKNDSGLLYTVLGVGIVIVAIAAFYLMLFSPKPPLDMSALEAGGEHKGNELAKVRIVEFSDFQCPSCGYAYGVMKQIYSQYADSIYFTYRHFPLSNIHPFAQKAAEASQCAGEQGKFWEYHDKLFENQDNLKVDDLKAYATGLGLDSSQFNACLESSKYAGKVASDYSLGLSYGVDSTPTFFINGQKYSNLSVDEFRQVIESKK
ncbi:MAG TPA: DsbA family protein [archaeon]|nr:DsbA family protein [archaeon]